MAIDLKNIGAIDTKMKPEELTKVASFIITADKAALPKKVVIDEKAEPIELKEDEVDEKEDLKIDEAIDAMVARWLRSSKNELTKDDENELKILAKKMYYERLKTGESRVIWRVLKEYITGVRSEIL